MMEIPPPFFPSVLSSLHDAVVRRNPQQIQELLSLGIPIDQRDPNEVTPLHYCAARGTLRNIKVLVEASANLKAVDCRGYSALHYAVTNKNTSDIIPYLVEQGIPTDSRDKEGNTPLHVCALRSNLKNLQVLLGLDAELGRLNGFGLTALHRAAMNKDNAEVLLYLLDKGMSMDARDDLGKAAIHVCASEGNKANMQVLLRKGCDIEMKTTGGLTPLYCAFSNAYARDMIEYLLSQGAAINICEEFGFSPLIVCAVKGTLEIVKLLVENGADIQAKGPMGLTVLHIAVANEQQEVVEFFVDKGVPLEARDDDGATALLRCVAFGSLENLRVLVRKGASIQTQDDQGKTAIHYGALNENAAAIVEFLLNQGLSIDARDNQGMTPLHYAAKIGSIINFKTYLDRGPAARAKQLEKRGFTSSEPSSQLASHPDTTITLKCLLNRRASINLKDNSGVTPLLACASGGNLQKMKLLVERGAKIDDLDEQGRSSLHLAASNTTDIIQYLLDKGMQLEVTDKLGRTPLLYCAAEGNLKSVVLLCEKGANLKSLDKRKRTALHHAAANREGGSIIEYLLAKGMSVDVLDDSGSSPLNISKELGITENEKILLKHGANWKELDSDSTEPSMAALSQAMMNQQLQ